MSLLLFKHIHQNTVLSCLVKGEKDIYVEEWDNIPQRCSESNVHLIGHLCREQLTAQVGYTPY